MNILLKKLRGYQRANRERFLLLHFQVLTLEEYIVYEFGIAITDWDESHTDTYGTFDATNDAIAEILGWTGSTVSKLRKRLVTKEFFIKDGNRYRAKDFEKWQLRKNPIAKMNDYTANRQHRLANLQAKDAKMQAFRAQNVDYSLVSSKGELSVSNPEDTSEYFKEEVSPDDIPF